MEILQNHYTLDIPAGCFPLTTDSMLLADFVRLPMNGTVLDLGSGCGTLGLLLCATPPATTIAAFPIPLTIPAGQPAAPMPLHAGMISVQQPN